MTLTSLNGVGLELLIMSDMTGVPVDDIKGRARGRGRTLRQVMVRLIRWCAVARPPLRVMRGYPDARVSLVGFGAARCSSSVRRAATRAETFRSANR